MFRPHAWISKINFLAPRTLWRLIVGYECGSIININYPATILALRSKRNAES